MDRISDSIIAMKNDGKTQREREREREGEREERQRIAKEEDPCKKGHKMKVAQVLQYGEGE